MTPENSNPVSLREEDQQIVDRAISPNTLEDIDLQDQKTHTEDLNKKRELASRFEAFCHRSGDRMFSGKISNIDELDVISPEWIEEIDLESANPETKKFFSKGSPGDKIQEIHPALLDYSKAKYDDDDYYKKMLEHPAFREKINGSDVVVDIGNGGNMALRVDARFLQRNGFKGRVIGVDPFRNINEVDSANGLNTEAIKKDGLSYLLEQPDGSENILCSNLEREIIDNRDYARALVAEILRVVPEDGVFICIHSDALYPIAKSIFPHSYEIKDNAYTYLFSKKPIQEVITDIEEPEIEYVLPIDPLKD